MATPITAPAIRQQINIAPVATVAPAAANAFDTSQWHAIDAAVQSSLAGIASGNTVGGFASIFQTDLLKNKGTNADGSLFTVAQSTALANAYQQAAGGGAGFRDQGGSAAPFFAAWDSRLHSMFGTTADPTAPVPVTKPAPVVVSPPPVLDRPTPNAVAAPTVAPAPIPAVIPAPAPLPPDPVNTQSIVAAVVAALTPSTPAATTTVSALQTTTDGTSATTATGTTTATPATDPTTSALLQALSGSSAGFTSPDSNVGTPSTGGIQQITPVAAPTSTTSNPSFTALGVGVVVVVGGIFAYNHFRHHGTRASAPAGAAAA